MSVYLYNLGFSTSDSYGQAGEFEAYQGSQTGLGQSSAWMMYNVPNQLPPGVVDGVAQMSALTPSQWNFVQGNTGMSLKPGDYVILRFFPYGINPSCNLRATAVVGRGVATPAPAAPASSAPFMAGSQPRPVIDIDNSPGSNWPGATGLDGAWTYCVGMIHGSPADYSLNVGASIYITSGAQQGTTMAYGQDPQMHVVTTMQGTAEDTAEETAEGTAA
jgi:hypothetical protein